MWQLQIGLERSLEVLVDPLNGFERHRVLRALPRFLLKSHLLSDEHLVELVHHLLYLDDHLVTGASLASTLRDYFFELDADLLANAHLGEELLLFGLSRRSQ